MVVHQSNGKETNTVRFPLKLFGYKRNIKATQPNPEYFEMAQVFTPTQKPETAGAAQLLWLLFPFDIVWRPHTENWESIPLALQMGEPGEWLGLPVPIPPPPLPRGSHVLGGYLERHTVQGQSAFVIAVTVCKHPGRKASAPFSECSLCQL